MPRKFKPWPSFARRLRIALAKNNMTSADLCRDTTLGSGQISNYLNGHQEPGATRIVQMCEALDVSADFLLGLTDEMKTLKKRIGGVESD